MKQILTLAAVTLLFVGCASQQGGTGSGSETVASDRPAPVVGGIGAGSGTPSHPFQSPGNDRNDTGTTSGTGVSDLGAANPSDQAQREPFDPRYHRRY